MKAPARTLVHGSRPFLLLLLALTALLLAGCGSDDEGGDGDGASTSATSTTSTTADEGDDEEESGGGEGGGPDCAVEGGDAGATGGKTYDAAPPYTLEEGTTYTAALTTSEGPITVQLDPEEGPCAANNFAFLAREGFYSGVPFHRIMKDFMVQTGDPLGNGSGGPGYSIKNDDVSMGYEKGVVAMANAGRDTGGSQFFIVHGENVQLPPDYSIFGKVTKGLDVLDKIANTPVGDNGQGEPSKPTRPVTLEKVTIAEAPAS